MKETKRPQLSVGKRKTAIARVWLKPGSGSFVVNGMPCSKYFSKSATDAVEGYFSSKAMESVRAAGVENKFDITCTVRGGGLTGQAEAIRHGIARALDLADKELRPTLRAHGLLTRDSRKVERKKYGKHKARKSTQYSKR